MNYFAKNLVFIRESLSLTQAEISTSTGLKRNTLSNWENSVSEPKIEDIDKIAHYFGVNPGVLIFEDLSKGNLIEKIKANFLQQKGNLNRNLMGNLYTQYEVNEEPLFMVKEEVVAYDKTCVECNKKEQVISLQQQLINSQKAQLSLLTAEIERLKSTNQSIIKRLESNPGQAQEA